MERYNSKFIMKFTGGLFIALLLLANIGCEKNKITAADENVVVTPPQPEAKFELQWSDEFDGTTLNSANWTHEVGYGKGGNTEQENYQAANSTVANGNLVITVRKETIAGVPQSNYTSGRIISLSKQEFKYGKIEARIKLPRGLGLWPAFWMLGGNQWAKGSTPGVGWPACGEIDIMEAINTEVWISGAAHWADAVGKETNVGNKINTTPGDYHVYSIIWTKDTIKWYLDGKFYNAAWIKDGVASTSEFHQTFYLLFNVAVGGTWPGQVIDDTKLPASMLVDYVRVYKQVE